MYFLSSLSIPPYISLLRIDETIFYFFVLFYNTSDQLQLKNHFSTPRFLPISLLFLFFFKFSKFYYSHTCTCYFLIVNFYRLYYYQLAFEVSFSVFNSPRILFHPFSLTLYILHFIFFHSEDIPLYI